MTKEELVRNLRPLETEWVNKDKHGFSRTLKVKTDFAEFKIIWYTNFSMLILPCGTEIWFDNCYLTTTFPTNIADWWIYLEYEGNKIPVHIPAFKKYKDGQK